MIFSLFKLLLRDSKTLRLWIGRIQGNERDSETTVTVEQQKLKEKTTINDKKKK